MPTKFKKGWVIHLYTDESTTLHAQEDFDRGVVYWYPTKQDAEFEAQRIAALRGQTVAIFETVEVVYPNFEAMTGLAIPE